MNAYNAQRVGAGTVALGLAQGAYELAVDFAKEREQFDRPIAEFQGLQWMLADMSVKLEAARSLTYRAAASRGPGGSAFPIPHLPPRPRSSRQRMRSRWSATPSRFTVPLATLAATRLSGCTATSGCSPSAVARPRSSGRSSRRGSST